LYIDFGLDQMKRFGIIVLSILVLYAGVAWVLEKCLRHDDHLDHAVSDHHSDSQTLSSHDDSRDPSVPVIHCTSMSEEVGPAVRVVSAEIRRSDSGASLHAVSSTDALSARLKNDLWLEALFKKLLTFSLPIDPSRHLLLSVLQI
jgi:hypothetical protein